MIMHFSDPFLWAIYIIRDPDYVNFNKFNHNFAHRQQTQK